MFFIDYLFLCSAQTLNNFGSSSRIMGINFLTSHKLSGGSPQIRYLSIVPAGKSITASGIHRNRWVALAAATTASRDSRDAMASFSWIRKRSGNVSETISQATGMAKCGEINRHRLQRIPFQTSTSGGIHPFNQHAHALRPSVTPEQWQGTHAPQPSRRLASLDTVPVHALFAFAKRQAALVTSSRETLL